MLSFARMDLQAVTGKLYIINGAVQPLTAETLIPGLLAQPAPSKAARGRTRDFLFVHLTLSGPAEETAVLSADLLDAIVAKFYATTGSTTAAMRGAIMQINDLLLRHNLHSGGPSREGAITMAVLRQGELFTLQVGEAVALLGHNYGIERLPPGQDHLITPLGRSSSIDIRYYHHRLQVADMLLLADPRLAHLPTTAFNDALIDSEVSPSLEKCAALVGDDSARILLIEFSDEAPFNLPEAPAQSRLGRFIAPTPQPRRDPDNEPVINRPERRPQPAMPVTQSRQPLSEGQPVLRRPPLDLDLDKVEVGVRRASAQTLHGASRFTAWMAALLARVRPPREPDAPAPDELGFGWGIFISVGVPILLAVIYQRRLHGTGPR
jgi:hypothetical protein